MNKKLLASFKAKNEKGRIRQFQFISYLSLLLNVVYTIVFVLIVLALKGVGR